MSNVTYGPNGSQIIEIVNDQGKPTGKYYVAVDRGDTTMIFEVPDGWNLDELTDIEDNQLTSLDLLQGYKNELYKSKQMFPVTNEELISGFGGPDGDRFVMMSTDIFQLSKDFEDVDSITSFLQGLDVLKTSASYWNEPVYLDAINDWYLEYGAEGLDEFFGSEQQGIALGELGISFDQYNQINKQIKNPIGYEADRVDYEAIIRDTINDLQGLLPESAIKFAADKWVSGTWSKEKTARQITKALDDSYSLEALDAEFSKALEGFDITKSTLKEDEAQVLLDTYLPVELHTFYNIGEIAGNLRNNPGYKATLIQQLKDKRFAAYPNLDKDIVWSNYVQSKQATVKSVLGIDVDSEDPMIKALAGLNDQSKELEYLRNIGMDSGNATVMADFTKNFMRAFGSGVVPSQSFVENQ